MGSMRRPFHATRRLGSVAGWVSVSLALVFLGSLILSLTLAPGAARASTPNWYQLSPGTNPGARQGMAVAYDAAHANVVGFGGQGGLGPLNDTWIWSGGTWTQVFPANSPSPRSASFMAFDPVAQRVILFAGNTTPCNPTCADLSDTWSWDGINWTQLFPKVSPAARSGHHMVTDRTRNEIVLFGGSHKGIFLDDTWLWNGSNWIQQSSASAAPVRFYHMMGYDGATGQEVIFGGETMVNGDCATLGDTWTFDGSTWVQNTSSPAPAARNYGQMVDANSDGIAYLFGGNASMSGPVVFDDTWQWNGASWTQYFPATTPAGRWRMSMVYDAAHHQVLMYGGVDTNGNRLSDTWILQ